MIIEKELLYPILPNNSKQTDIQYKNIIFRVNNDTGIYNIHRALISQLENNRSRNANTKSRSEVRGGGRKPWKQKGSGRARAGSSRSPLWKGGGVIFGPKTKIIKHKINQKEKHLALRTILYNKFHNTFLVENSFNTVDGPKTKNILDKINKLNINIQQSNQILIIVTNKNRHFYLSTRNLANIQVINANQINIIALLRANTLIITLDAMDTINAIYNKKT